MSCLRRFFSTFLLALLVFLQVPAWAAEAGDRSQSASESLTLGVLSYRPKPQTLERWQPLVDYLNEELESARLELVPYFMDEMQEAVAQGEVDFIFTQPSHYVLLTYRNELSSPLAMLVNNEAGTPVSSFGGVIFAPATSELKHLSDLQGLTLATPQQQSLGAFQMQAFELLQAGLKAESDYSLLEVGMPQDKVVRAVMAGDAQAGFVRSGVLESLVAQGKLDPQAYRVINPQQHPAFPFQVSSRLYPEWPFVALPGTDELAVRQIATALFNLPLQGERARAMDIAGFTLPGDYRSIDELLFQLQLPPFEHLAEFDILYAWEQWQPEGGILLSLLILLLLVGIALLVLRNSELRRAYRHLRISGEEVFRLSQAMEQSPEGILITDNRASVEYINPAFEKHTGFTREEMLGKNPNVLSSGTTSAKTYRELWRALKRGHVWRGEFINQRKDTSEYLVSVLIAPIRNKAGQITHYMAVEQDVTEKRAAEERLTQLTYYDPLTNVPNRGLQMDRIQQLLSSSQKSGKLAALLLIDIDRFKFINDALGPDVGDQVLVEMSRRLKGCLPDSASLARMAADEFSVLLNDLNPRPELASREVLDEVQRLQRSMRQGFALEGKPLHLTVSVGITLFPEESKESPAGILTRADTALHRAKGSGGNSYRFYEVFMGQQVVQHFDLEADLRQALEADELEVYLQPQCQANGKRVGAEALLRWWHPSKGQISPAVFIPLAENSDLVVDLDRWVIGQVLSLLKKKGEEFKHAISVNISPRHFAQGDFVGWLRKELERQQVDPCRLILEFTEGVLIDDIADTVSKMQQLTALGLKFSVDDFGTGYSSLAYIKQLPLHELKIDRAFVLGIGKTQGDAGLLKSILAVAECMQLEVVVEGVETQEQLDFFKAYHRISFQGFYFSRPLPVPDFLNEM